MSLLAQAEKYLEGTVDTITAINSINLKVNDLVSRNRASREHVKTLVEEHNQVYAEVQRLSQDIDKHTRALMLIGTASDKAVEEAITKVTVIINQALLILFPRDKRTISIKKTLYRQRYVHFEVILETSSGKKRSFKMSGTGLAQIVSSLFTISFIDISGGRKILIADEIFNGLHPKAKVLMREILTALKDYQFIVIEHNVDIGKQYELLKEGQVAFIRHYKSGNYYTDFSLKARGVYVEEENGISHEGNGIYVTDNSIDDLPINVNNGESMVE